MSNSDVRTTRRLPAVTGHRAADTRVRRLRAERGGAPRRVDAVVAPDSMAWRSRALSIAILFGLCFLLIGARLVWLAVGPNERLDRKLVRQAAQNIEVAPERGAIVDRLGRPLAISVELASVFADPKLVREGEDDKVTRDDAAKVLAVEEAADLLAPILGVDTATLREQVGRAGSRFVWLGRQIPVETARRIQVLDIPGIRVLPEAHRSYPQGRLAAQILGFTNIDGFGLEGLESRWNKDLLGDAFTYSVERDGRRRPTNYDAVLSRRSTEGNTLVLTLDQTVQHRAETALAAAIEKHGAAGGWIVVLEVDTGAVLGMASNPTFEPAEWKTTAPERWRNRSATDVYEPGSTMKALVFAAVLDRGLAKIEEQVYCERGNYRVGGRVVHDAHPHEWLSVADVLKVSSNIGTAKLADRIGPEALEQAYRQFGLGSRTGIDLAGEEVGILRPWTTWGRIGFANHAFGQGMAVTGIQLASAYCTLVNGGHRVQPHVVAEIRSPEDKIVHRWVQPERVAVISEATSLTMRELLGRVVEPGGTGPRAALAEYRVGGKTGTAQKVKGGVYAAGLYVSSFIGFAPVEDPRVVTLVVLDEPHIGHYGGTVAGPACAEVTLTAMRALGVPPSPPPLPPPPPPGTPTIMPEEPGDIDPATLPPPSLLAEIEIPSAPAPLWIADLADPEKANIKASPPKTLLAVAGGWIVPDLTGLSVRDALAALAGADVHMDVLGTGEVAAQAPAPGQRIRRGERLSLQLISTVPLAPATK